MFGCTCPDDVFLNIALGAPPPHLMQIVGPAEEKDSGRCEERRME